MLDKLLNEIVMPETRQAVGTKAVVGVLSHLIATAANGDKTELNSWLRDPERFARWRASATTAP